jgi:hypothetical protein
MQSVLRTTAIDTPAILECPEITLPEIEKAVRRAAPNKAPGTDEIPNGILHQTLGILLPSLHKLFNACLQQGYCTLQRDYYRRPSKTRQG